MAPWTTRFIACVAFAALVSTATVHGAGLRRNMESWSLVEEAHGNEIMKEKTLSWHQTADGQFAMDPLEKMSGDEAIVVFHDRTESAEAAAETALVTFNVRSSPNCVVNVCGSMRNWIMQSSEQCWELKIAHKSSDPAQNGLIRGISASFTPGRPIAKKLYLKFDPINYIDGSPCEYELFEGAKQNTTSPTTATPVTQES